MLLACFVLPMHSCTTSYDEQGREYFPPSRAPANAHCVITRYYLIDALKPGDPITWLAVGSFAAPAAIVLYRNRRPSTQIARIAWYAEPLVVIGVAWSFLNYSWDLFARDEIGDWSAAVGLLLCMLGWLGEASCRLFTFVRRRFAGPPAGDTR